MKTVDAYIRVSTKHQLRDDDTGSLASQELKIRQYCQLNNLSLQRIFVDEGKSGKNTNRPALQNLLKRIESGHTDGVVVYTLSRFSRSVRDLQNILHGPLRGKEFHSCQEKIDVNTAFGQFFLTILGALAEMERKMSAERTKEGLARRREMWVKSGISKKLGAVPYGYRQVTDKDGKRIKYEPDQDQQRIWRRLDVSEERDMVLMRLRAS